MADTQEENQIGQELSLEQLDSNYVKLASLRASIPQPSARNPKTPWDHNVADQIERQMTDDGHLLWGFVIYRTSYDNEEDWLEFVRRLTFEMEDVFEYYGGRDVLGKFEMTVMEGGRDRWEGATAAVVREDFKQWSLSAWRDEQRAAVCGDGQRMSIARSQRYHFAVQVDAESLRSVVPNTSVPPDINTRRKGWVRLIDKSWYLGRSFDGDDPLPAIEGITTEDVGWMKVTLRQVMSSCYSRARSPNFWTREYRRPPQLRRL